MNLVSEQVLYTAFSKANSSLNNVQLRTLVQTAKLELLMSSKSIEEVVASLLK